MKAYRIETEVSDYPFLVVANGYNNALDILNREGIQDADITNIQRLKEYESDHILIENSK